MDFAFYIQRSNLNQTRRGLKTSNRRSTKHILNTVKAIPQCRQKHAQTEIQQERFSLMTNIKWEEKNNRTFPSIMSWWAVVQTMIETTDYAHHHLP